MKKFNLIFISIVFVAFVITSILASFNAYYMEIFSSLNFYVVLMVAFCFAKSKVLNVVGYCIGGLIGVVSLNYIIVLAQGDVFLLLLPCFASIALFIPSVVYFVSACLRSLGFIKNSGVQQSQDSKIDLLRLYGELNKDGLITEEEFANVKKSVIVGGVKENKEKLVQLRELKKLFDEQVITKDEFVSFNK